MKQISTAQTDAGDEQLERTFIPLYNKNCNRCAHLVSHEREFFETCHWSAGNASCPAAEFKLGLNVNQEKATNDLFSAFDARDCATFSRKVAKLATYDAEVGAQVLELLSQKIGESYGVSFEDADEGDNDEPDEADADTDAESEVDTDAEGEDDASVDDLVAAADAGSATDADTTDSDVTDEVRKDTHAGPAASDDGDDWSE